MAIMILPLPGKSSLVLNLDLIHLPHLQCSFILSLSSSQHTIPSPQETISGKTDLAFGVDGFECSI